MQLLSVDTTDEALDVLAGVGGQCQILAGGTDVMIQLGRQEIQPEVLLHVERIAELRQTRVNGVAFVGSLVTHRQVATGILGTGYRAVAEAAATVGGLQTQSVGTIGGNVCNASPAADTIPALLVHDAEVTLRSRRTTRSMPLAEFLLGRRATARAADELLTAVMLAPAEPRTGDTYLKVGRRSAMEVAIVGLAMRLTFDPSGVVTDARIALASLGPAVMRAGGAEAVLVGSFLTSETVSASSVEVLAGVTPRDDLRATAEYRSRLIPGLLRRAARICAERAGVPTDLGVGAPR
jgi:CO/xanthine dehydrogenase FAD-binding subunit